MDFAGWAADVYAALTNIDVLLVPSAPHEATTRVILEDGAYPSITNVGMRPTFAESARSIEAHIFDFTREIYGQRIKLELVERIRAERKFDTPDALKAQIALDLGKAREILAAA